MPQPPYTTDEEAENIRTEYAAVVKYFVSIVNSRFTIAGLYLPGVGFLASAIFDKDTPKFIHTYGPWFALFIAFSLFILELRNRILYTDLADRGIEIERKMWGLKMYSGFFSRQYKKTPARSLRRKVLRLIARLITHSWGFNLLYIGSIVFWLFMIIFAPDATGQIPNTLHQPSCTPAPSHSPSLAPTYTPVSTPYPSQ